MLEGTFSASLVRLLMGLSLVLGSPAVKAESSWLTVSGNPDDFQTDVVQVDPASLSGNPSFPTLSVRVSRATLRTSWDNVPYRSYTSTVLIDCADKSGRYTEITFYMMPFWQGKPHKSTTFAPEEMRPMRFRQIEPNPTSRIVRAACAAFTR